jgi:two-component system KDP operon response regulator KdpE
MKVLIIEDDKGIVEAISLAFQIRWPEAELISIHLGEKGIELVESESPDIVILDLGLPDITGFDVLKRIRLFSSVPVIILTVRAEEPDIVKGLEWGADDYVVKPFRQLELLSRIRALTRRQADLAEETVVSYGPLQLNPSTRELTYGERAISLTVTESRILQQLIKNGGRVVTHSNLAESIWGKDYEDATDALKVYIRRMRQKIEEDPSQPKLILTKAGIGYQLVKPD